MSRLEQHEWTFGSRLGLGFGVVLGLWLDQGYKGLSRSVRVLFLVQQVACALVIECELQRSIAVELTHSQATPSTFEQAEWRVENLHVADLVEVWKKRYLAYTVELRTRLLVNAYL